MYSDDAARINKGYRTTPFLIELRNRDMDYDGFLLPADQVTVYHNTY